MKRVALFMLALVGCAGQQQPVTPVTLPPDPYATYVQQLMTRMREFSDRVKSNEAAQHSWDERCGADPQPLEVLLKLTPTQAKLRRQCWKTVTKSARTAHGGGVFTNIPQPKTLDLDAPELDEGWTRWLAAQGEETKHCRAFRASLTADQLHDWDREAASTVRCAHEHLALLNQRKQLEAERVQTLQEIEILGAQAERDLQTWDRFFADLNARNQQRQQLETLEGIEYQLYEQNRLLQQQQLQNYFQQEQQQQQQFQNYLQQQQQQLQNMRQQRW